MGDIKKDDQLKLLEAAAKENDTGDISHLELFTYPNCPNDLFKQGLISGEGKVTMAGRAVLWFSGMGADPTDSKASFEFDLNLNK